MNDARLPFRVVLTGGIASGKTTVANEFAALGVPIIDADQLSRDVVEPGSPTLKLIVDEFGAGILGSDGRMDRRVMRERVFSDPTQRKKLESITWPAIGAEFERRSAAASGLYQIHAIPLFIESGRKGSYDRVLVVDCPEDIQVQRLMRRDRVDAAGAGKILEAQTSRSTRLAAADDVVINDGNFATLREQVQRLHDRYIKMAAGKA